MMLQQVTRHEHYKVVTRASLDAMNNGHRCDFERKHARTDGVLYSTTHHKGVQIAVRVVNDGYKTYFVLK